MSNEALRGISRYNLEFPPRIAGGLSKDSDLLDNSQDENRVEKILIELDTKWHFVRKTLSNYTIGKKYEKKRWWIRFPSRKKIVRWAQSFILCLGVNYLRYVGTQKFNLYNINHNAIHAVRIVLLININTE